MNFRAGLSAELPAPRDDEPGGLRDDILDELADHLACAYRRELLRGADTATARQRVLERFGDPAALARRLWFDAMKGKIMSQRILVVCCIVLTAISLSLAFMMWNQAVHAQRLAALAQAEMAEQMRRAELDQQQMRSHLESMSKEAVNPRFAPEQVPVRVQCNWPRDDAFRGVVLNTFFVSDRQTDGDGRRRDYYSQRSMICGGPSDPYLSEIRGNQQSLKWTNGPGSPWYAEMLTADLRKLANQGDPVEWDAGDYKLMSLAVLRQIPAPPDKTDRTRFEVLARVHPPSQPGMGTPTVPTPEAFWQTQAAGFLARREHVNQWTIPLPDELIKAVREKLKAETKK
jgi:hypothetical protein